MHVWKRNMEIETTPLAGLLLVKLKIFRDARGFFDERFHEEKFTALGLPVHFAQDNHSYSHPRVLRGMHYQHTPAQGKLVGAIRGSIYDVAVDVRPDSSTFGQHFGAELTGDNGLLLWVPAGFAHGFCVVGEQPADVIYKVTAPWNATGEGGIRFDDPELGIRWPVADPMVIERDRLLPTFAEYRKNPPRR